MPLPHGSDWPSIREAGREPLVALFVMQCVVVSNCRWAPVTERCGACCRSAVRGSWRRRAERRSIAAGWRGPARTSLGRGHPSAPDPRRRASPDMIPASHCDCTAQTPSPDTPRAPSLRAERSRTRSRRAHHSVAPSAPTARSGGGVSRPPRRRRHAAGLGALAAVRRGRAGATRGRPGRVRSRTDRLRRESLPLDRSPPLTDVRLDSSPGPGVRLVRSG